MPVILRAPESLNTQKQIALIPTRRKGAKVAFKSGDFLSCTVVEESPVGSDHRTLFFSFTRTCIFTFQFAGLNSPTPEKTINYSYELTKRWNAPQHTEGGIFVPHARQLCILYPIPQPPNKSFVHCTFVRVLCPNCSRFFFPFFYT